MDTYKGIVIYKNKPLKYGSKKSSHVTLQKKFTKNSWPKFKPNNFMSKSTPKLFKGFIKERVSKNIYRLDREFTHLDAYGVIGPRHSRRCSGATLDKKKLVKKKKRPNSAQVCKLRKNTKVRIFFDFFGFLKFFVN